MNFIIIMAGNIREENQKNWFVFLSIQKYLVEKSFDWLNFNIDYKNRILKGKGFLIIQRKKYEIKVYFSPYFESRYDRIFINDKSIRYTKNNHLYEDNSLCLYHPLIDKPLFQIIPLVRMIPWISEWIIWYEQWKKYGVWLGEEIKH